MSAPPPQYGSYGAPPPAYGSYPPPAGAPPAGGAPPPAYDPYAPSYGHGPSYAPPPSYGAPPAHHYPPHPAPAGPVHYGPDGEELRTIFVTGFPTDVKERELNNLCRFLHGYQAGQMSWKNGQAQGFALFETGALAVAACTALSHVQFDEASVLRAEMARKNMFIASKDPGDPAAKRARFNPPPGAGGAPVQPAGFAPVTNMNDNPPCSTLFVGNLSDSVVETELHGLFAQQPGFKQLKVVRNGRNTNAFVDFLDVPTATATHRTLQGAIISSSSNRGGMRIQFSKNPSGRRNDNPTH